MSPQKPNPRSRETTATIIGDYLDFIEAAEPHELVNGMESFWQRMDKCGMDAISALAAGLHHTGYRARIVAAWALGLIERFSPGTIRDEELLSKASDTLVTSLRNESTDTRLFACSCLLHGNVPKKAIPILRRLLNADDELLSVFSAAALAACDVPVPDAIPPLALGLQHKNEIVRAVAGAAFRRIGIRSTSLEEATNALRSDNELVVFTVLQGLTQVGPAALRAAPAIAEFIANTKARSYLRRIALKALASVTRGTDGAVVVLTTALRAREWEVVSGAIDGFSLLGRFPDSAASCLIHCLSADNENMRRVAAIGLKEIGPEAAVAIPALIAQAQRETIADVFYAILASLAGVGAAAVPYLIPLIKDEKLRSHEIAGGAFEQMGSEAADAIAKLLLSDPDESVRRTAVIVLELMGPRAAPAVPALAAMLDELPDEELTPYVVAAIGVCGPAGKHAVPSLVRCFTKSSEQVAEWVAHVLRRIGPAAIPELKTALASVQGDECSRLEGLLNELQPAADDRFSRLAPVDRKLLEVFVAVGEILREQGTASFHSVAKVIRDRVKDGTYTGKTFERASERTLSVKVRKLSAIFGPLTTHEPRLKGGLTEEGLRLLNDAQEYLKIYK